MISKKNILFFLSAVCFLAPLLYTGYFLVKKQVLKTSVAQRFKKENLQTLIIKTDAIIWEKKGKEIKTEEGLFDVAEITYEQDIAIIRGWFDHQESKLNKDFSKTKTRTVYPFLMYTYFQSPINPVLQKINTLFLQHHSNYHPVYRKSVLDVITPPPIV